VSMMIPNRMFIRMRMTTMKKSCRAATARQSRCTYTDTKCCTHFRLANDGGVKTFSGLAKRNTSS
jgi:hypothetical protein